jgi:hypothetical protein
MERLSFGKLIEETIKISARHWWLWLFGFFISLADAGGSWGQISEDIDVGDFSITDPEWIPAIAAGILALIGFAILVYLILLIISECSLMVAVRDIKSGGRGALVESLSTGLNYFWRILAIWLMLLFLAIFSILFFGIIIVLGFVTLKVVGLLILLICLPIWLVEIFVVELIVAFAYRFVVIDNLGVIESIVAGWHLFKRNVGDSIVTGLIAIASYIVFGIISLVILLIVGIPFIVAGAVDLWLGLIPGLIVGFFVLVVIEGFTGTYRSALWTLAYLQLREKPESQPAVTTA